MAVAVGPSAPLQSAPAVLQSAQHVISQQLLFLKQPGRVGQVSCFGCGCWAQCPIAVGTSSVAVSTTGNFTTAVISEAAGTRGSGQLLWLQLLGPAPHCSRHQQCCRQHNRYISQQLLFLKQLGRVGQSSCFGCGCWAQRSIAVGTSSVAVSTTGNFTTAVISEAARTSGSGQLLWLQLLGSAPHCSRHQQFCSQHNR